MEDPNAFSVGSVEGYGKQGQSQNLGEENQNEGNQPKDPFYTMPGVLHFLQTEWSKFEMERSQWEVERAELQARIAFLQGERKGQENLKHDLVRRIKMLEFALRQERAKFHRLKFGSADSFDGPSTVGLAGEAAAVAASEEEGFRSAMGLSLGDLQDITVANERDYDDDVGPGSARRTWASKFSLRSHLDSVRGLAFHPTDATLLTASEDGTVKLWNLCSRAAHQEASAPSSSADSRCSPGAAGPQVELEPVHTYRGHAGPVLTVCVSPDGGLACSGGLDGCVRVWRLPPTLAGLDQYDAFDASLVGEALEGHRDAVWSLASIGPDSVFSVGADSTLRSWRTRRHGDDQSEETPLLRTSQLTGRPTSLAVVPADPGKLLVSMATDTDAADSGSSLLLIDAETGQIVLRMPTAGAKDSGEAAGAVATRVVAHPTQSTAIAGYSDRCIRCYDYASGELTHSMLAHLDSVTSLAVDPNGLYLVSGSHDASVRVWSLDDPRSCVQEISAAHRRKFDEAVHDLALHPAKSLLASAGADALAKVFV